MERSTSDSRSRAAEVEVESTVGFPGEITRGGGLSFISVAFTTALLFVPMVVAAGFLTARSPPAEVLSGMSIDALRLSIDGGGSGLRGDIE